MSDPSLGGPHQQRFRVVTRDAAGAKRSDIVTAPDRKAAIQRLLQQGLIVTDLRPDSATDRADLFSGGRLRTERILFLRQMGVMLKAGVELLDAIETLGASNQGPTANAIRGVATSLRRGDPVADAFRSSFPEYPDYVHALIRAGDASGRLGEVIGQAAQQLAFEERLRRDLLNALAYPLFLMSAAALVVLFLLTVVVPRYADMLGARIDDAPLLSRVVLRSGAALGESPMLAFALFGGLVLLCAWAATSRQTRTFAWNAATRLPVLGALYLTSQRARWAKIMAFATGAGVGVLDATSYANMALADGVLRRNLSRSEQDLRSGRPVHEVFDPAIDGIDISLLRAGERSGALPEMFAMIAERHEEDLRDALKRTAIIVEQGAIGLVALTIGAIVLAIASAITGVYDGVL